MVDESLHQYLHEALSRCGLNDGALDKKLRDLLRYDRLTPSFSGEEISALIDAIDHIKVLDPACGSGAFPMGALLKLVHVLSQVDSGNFEWKARQIGRIEALKQQTDRDISEPEICSHLLADYDAQVHDIEEAFARNDLDYGRKLYLIENCIYGVDIQPIAVQIAKLRFFISLVVNEKIEDSRPNRGIRALPNLETNFVAANTLVKAERPQQENLLGYDPRIPAKEEELKRVRRRLFSVRKLRDKKALRAQDEKLREELAALLVEDHYSADIAKAIATWNPFDQNTSAGFFDPEWMFVETKGFHIVIGNPPYLRLQGLQATQPEFVPYYRDHYSSSTGSFDIYALFLERGLDFLDEAGQLVYILPHKFFQAGFAVALRKMLTERKALRQIVRFGAEQVFEEATTYTCLLFLSQIPRKEFDLFEVKSLAGGRAVLDDAQNGEEHPDYTHELLPAPVSTDWDFSIGSSSTVLKRLQQHRRNLNDITRKIFVGLQTSADKIYVLEVLDDRGEVLLCYSKHLDTEIEIERGLVKPFLMGKDVHRYEVANLGHVVVFPYVLDNGKAELFSQSQLEQFQLGWSYLTRCKKYLEEREKGRFAEHWWAYGRPQNINEFATIKIMTPDICARPEMTLDSSGQLYHTTTLYSFVFKPNAGGSTKYFLGLLNSKVLWYFLTVTGTPLRGGYIRFKTEYLKPFPIPETDEPRQQLIESLADYVLTLKALSARVNIDQTRKTLMTAFFERLIDAVAYELYFPEDFPDLDKQVSHQLKIAQIPSLANLPEEPFMALHTLFERLYAPELPVRQALLFLDTIESVRVIEEAAQ